MGDHPPRHPQRVHYIAGASGAGTSTRALQLQQEWARSGTARPSVLVATDVVRAQLRAVLSQDAAPDLWGESFNLPARPGDVTRDGVAIDAFLRQCGPILRAVEAGVEYALSEGWNVIVEGVHLVPGAFQLAAGDDIEATFELLVVEDEAEHLERFRSRDAASGGRRPFEHYRRNLARVRAVQAELAERWAAQRPTGA